MDQGSTSHRNQQGQQNPNMGQQNYGSVPEQDDDFNPHTNQYGQPVYPQGSNSSPDSIYQQTLNYQSDQGFQISNGCVVAMVSVAVICLFAFLLLQFAN